MPKQQSSTSSMIDRFVMFSHEDIETLFNKYDADRINIVIHSIYTKYNNMNILSHLFETREKLNGSPWRILNDVKFLVEKHNVDINTPDGRGNTLFKSILMQEEKKFTDEFYKYVIENSELLPQKEIDILIKKNNKGPTLSIWKRGLLSYINDTRAANDAVINAANNTVLPYDVRMQTLLRKYKFHFTPETIRAIIQNNIMDLTTAYENNHYSVVYIISDCCSRLKTPQSIGDDMIYSSGYIGLFMCNNKHICMFDRPPYKHVETKKRCREIFLNIIKTIARGGNNDIPNDTITETIDTLANAFHDTHALITPYQ